MSSPVVRRTIPLFASALCLSSVLAGCGDAATPVKVDDKVVGVPAPGFSLEAVNTKGSVSMASLQGQVVIVDFWGTFCEPCKKSFPKLQSLYAKYKSSGLTVVGISEDDDKDAIVDFANSFGAKFPLVWDGSKAVAGKWNPGSMPATFIVDRKGVVRFLHHGYHDHEEDEMEQQVKSLL